MKTKTRNPQWKYGEDLTKDELIMVRYATRCWLLQECGGLTFEEARIYLAGEPPFPIESVTEELKLSREEIERRQIELKCRISELERTKEVFYGYTAIEINSAPNKYPRKKPEKIAYIAPSYVYISPENNSVPSKRKSKKKSKQAKQ